MEKIQVTHHTLPLIPNVISLFEYNTPGIKEILYALKFSHEPTLHPEFQALIKKKIKALNLDYDILLPVPAHPKKESERGYNPVHILFKSLIDPKNTSLLKRQKNTKSLHKLSKKDRKQELIDSFSIQKNPTPPLKNKKILLVDDIFTTGSTLHEIAKLLIENNVKSIESVTICHKKYEDNNK